ncbi:MAG: cell division protein FtsQ/DivIB [Thermodesulfovibrionales bacterium]
MKKPAKKGRKNTLVKKGGSASPAVLRMKNFGIILLPLLAVLSSVYLVTVLFRSAFPLEHIVFSGSEHLSDEDLRQLTGLKGGENLAGLPTAQVYKSMSASPWVQSLSIRKEFPATLHIKVREAEPFALLEMDSRYFIMDNRGKLLEELRDSPVPFLPVIIGNPFSKKEGFAEAISLVRAIKESGLMSRKDRIEVIANRPQDMTVNLDGVVVKIGSGEYPDKLTRLMELEEEIRNRRIPVDYIDLRFANKVVVKPVNEVVRR